MMSDFWGNTDGWRINLSSPWKSVKSSWISRMGLGLDGTKYWWLPRFPAKHHPLQIFLPPEPPSGFPWLNKFFQSFIIHKEWLMFDWGNWEGIKKRNEKEYKRIENEYRVRSLSGICKNCIFIKIIYFFQLLLETMKDTMV